MHVYIEDIGRYEGKDVEIKGWVYNTRSSGKVRFLLVRDGTGIIQSVISSDEVNPDLFRIADQLTQESSLILEGTVRAEPRAPGGYEILPKGIKVFQFTRDYPITPKAHSVEFLLPIRHLWLRSKKQNAILRIRHEIIKAIRDFLDHRGFINCDTPILTPAAVEGTTTLFPVDYFGDKVYLTQSGQLYNEATAAAMGKVYCFGPTFRAEKSKTRRHLMEFWMVEPEVAYLELDGIMDLEEDLVVYIIERVLEKRRPELQILERDINKLEAVKKPFPRITYREAVERIHKQDQDFKAGDDFGAPQESILSESYDRPVMVHRYPAAVKAFYMKHDPVDDNLSLSVDMIAPEGYGEIVGGGQREDDHELLVKRIKEHRLPMDAYKWFLDLRLFGTCPHGGFGLGLERTIAWICKVPHVRETIPFPRMLDKIYP
jgi:asparaginyl-tRNA synthetase